MKNATAPEGTSSARRSARSKSKEKATGNAPSFQRAPDPRVGTRSVNTLSDAQLERKRANDREAQRIIRQRTREHIENLERQVAELSEEKEQLSKAVQHNSDLEAQIAALQRQVADMALLLQYRQSPGVQGFTDTTPAYDASPMNDPSAFSVPVSHAYAPASTAESRPMYNPYDMPMAVHGPISLHHEPSSSGVSSMTSASYNEDADMTTGPHKYNVHPGSSAPPIQSYPHQGLPPTSMALPSHQYPYPASYNADPWNQNRPG